MAEPRDLLGQDQFGCSICLDPLKDPVTIPCGHSYCMGCIKGYWDQDDQRKPYCCPQCRETFSPRPLLKKNTLMAEMMEKQKMTRPKASSPVKSREYVECDICTEDKNKAVQSCLQCLASFCESHIQPHYESPAFRRHKLVSASTHLQENICQRHGKLLEVYCKDDQTCICYPCVICEHKGHDTVPAESMWTDKQEELKAARRKCQDRLQEKIEEKEVLKQAVDSLKCSGHIAVEDSERIFTELIDSIERRRREVRELIRAQEKAELSWAERLLERLEQEIAELQARSGELEKLSQIDDKIQFLQKFHPPVYKDSTRIKMNLRISFDPVTKCVSELNAQMEDVFRVMIDKISRNVPHIRIAERPQPTKREEFLLYSTQLTVDTNTSHRTLCFSEGYRKITNKGVILACPDCPERFDGYPNVLCKGGLSGRHYWEAECSGREVTIAVSYKGIRRKGRGSDCRFGYNSQSWRLHCSPSRCYFRHGNRQTEIPLPGSSRIGVYLDHSEGILSFYNVSDGMTLLHREQTTFSEPVYPGFGIATDSAVTLYEL
ncbi:tripartite motif-containing protein 16 [Chanos chanos]|uniref:Tripartite motif-containing protein 16 n=1 Tax=Chanos chanos TaxID=29144 RepID=A0A6J2VNX2_CHACN|nr:tripartite motif-containing protein 16-like [Chanos chanos]